jgi:putative transposase
MAYHWRRLGPREREELLALRKFVGHPWHRPPHFDISGRRTVLLTAACYEHKPVIGASISRMKDFSRLLLETADPDPVAWCVLPNHYHVLVSTEDLPGLLGNLGRLHGKTSREWNLEENSVGRKVWFGVSDRRMRSNGHYWATINYIHHNPVKHGYAKKWDEWPFSSAASYLDSEGRTAALEAWEQYPVGDYGKGWDDL